MNAFGNGQQKEKLNALLQRVALALGRSPPSKVSLQTNGDRSKEVYHLCSGLFKQTKIRSSKTNRLPP